MSKCTCGTQSVGGLCSSWCDTNQPLLSIPEKILELKNPFTQNNMLERMIFMKKFPSLWKTAMDQAGLDTPFQPAVNN